MVVVLVLVESAAVNLVGLVVPLVGDVVPGDVPKSQVLIIVLEDDPDTYSVVIHGVYIRYMNSNYTHGWHNINHLVYLFHITSDDPTQTSTKCSLIGIVVGTLVILFFF